ncbi:MAG: hypothetical protein SOT07_01625 [Paludibacteraceae bacterium]|nr:hypothetical protein [Paludibacteraceae bacterium]
MLLTFFSILTLSSCGNSRKDTLGMPEETYQQYLAVNDTYNLLTEKLNNPQQCATAQGIQEIIQLNQQLVFDYNPADMDSAALAECNKTKQAVDTVHALIKQFIQDLPDNAPVLIYAEEDALLEKEKIYPIYLEKDDKLLIDIELEQKADIKIYNAQSKKLVKSYCAKQVNETIPIPFKAVYVVQIIPRVTQYATVTIGYYAHSLERLLDRKRVQTEIVSCNKGEFLAYGVKGVKMQPAFEEPRKFTLRGQLKAMFAGSDRAIVSIPVPAGATDLLYQLRISTNERDVSSDGNFNRNMELKYNEIKVLGLPVYESHRGAGIISTLLGIDTPVREEDAYINMYVFNSAAEAKKFQDGKLPSTLKYDVNYSTMGTQSCNGRIPTKGKSTIYLGFMNERVRFNNYVWLEASTIAPKTEYFNYKYTIKDAQ